MADAVPAIRVTDPHSDKSRPVTATSPPQSPSKHISLNAMPGAFEQNGISPQLSRFTSPNGSLRKASTASSRSAEAAAIKTHVACPPASPSSVDPLTKLILDRTTTLGAAREIQRRSAAGLDGLGIMNGTGSTLSTGKSSSEIPAVEGVASSPAGKDKKKGVSFFSRIIGTKNKKEDAPTDSKAGQADDRPEGADAQVFAESFDNMSYRPRYPQPPSYIKVHAQGKKKEFDRLFLAQELRDREPRPGHLQKSSTSGSLSRMKRIRSDENSNAVWALEFSRDGKYIAAGGQDKIVRVWTVLHTGDDRRQLEKDEEAASNTNGGSRQRARLQAPVFKELPFRTYAEHESPVLDLSWSKNNFLLSSSMDKTVRLWHVSRSECLCVFKHTDFVTSIQFHARDDRFFLAGSLDSKLRLWSIPDKSVAFWNQVPEMITAVAFTPDGKTAIAGCLNGICSFYETEGLKYQTQMHVRSAHGKNAKGSKITGIETITFPPTDPNGDVKLLITSNDSRVRLYNHRDKSLEVKFKGNVNTSSQIHARFSDDARYIISGSEDKRVFVWSVTGADHEEKEKRPVEIFEAHSSATTVCAVAPSRTRQLLGASGDPLYDLCNPPPVTLMSRADAESIYSGRGAADDGSSNQPTTPAITSPAITENSHPKRPGESAAYTARSAHSDGNIIVTADATGTIKIFRQDCAHEQRMQWDAAPRKFSSTGYLRRHSSKASSSRSLKREDSSFSQPSRDRILSWRQSINSTSSFDVTNGVGMRRSPVLSPVLRTSPDRTGSISPKKKFSHVDLRAHRTGLFGGRSLSYKSGSPVLGGTRPSSVRESSYENGELSQLSPMSQVSPGLSLPSPQQQHPTPTRQDSRDAMPPPARPSNGAHVQSSSKENDIPRIDGAYDHSKAQPTISEPVHPQSEEATRHSTLYYDQLPWRTQIMDSLRGGQAQAQAGSRSGDGRLLRPSITSATSASSYVSQLTDELSVSGGEGEGEDGTRSQGERGKGNG